VVLEAAGFVRTEDKEHDAHIAYHRVPDSIWEMHWQLAGIPQGDAGGNFGSKDSERINQAKFMTDRNTGRIDGKSMGVKLITFMNQKARSALPICDKYKVLLPVGWLYTGGRHLVRIAQGKRPKIHVNAMMEGARKRREIYKEFHLYEM
jgi:hypothetical protein